MNNVDHLDDTASCSLEISNKFANRNIKERLNLHVKRRIQESTTDSCASVPTQSTQSAFNIQTSPVAAASSSKRGTSSERGSGSHSGRGGKRSRKLVTNIPVSTSSTAGDDECSRDESQSCTSEVSREKEHSPDILSMVLNQKKLSLFNDPEVKQFLDGIVGIIAKKTEESKIL